MYCACSWALHQALSASAKLLSTPRSSANMETLTKQEKSDGTFRDIGGYYEAVDGFKAMLWIREILVLIQILLISSMAFKMAKKKKNSNYFLLFTVGTFFKYLKGTVA
jgi:hypothetical protein